MINHTYTLNITVKISKEGYGNVEIILVKQATGKIWSSLGKELPGHHKLIQKSERGRTKWNDYLYNIV